MARGRLSVRLATAGALGALASQRHGIGRGLQGGSSALAHSRRTVAKSVHACMAVEWLADTFALEVVVVRRHPAAVLASWLELDLPDARRGLDARSDVRSRFLQRWGMEPPAEGGVASAAWQLGLLSSALEEALARNTRWHVRSHEELCRDPQGEFRSLYAELGLEWGEAAEALLEEEDRPGSGFEGHRRASELPDSWRSRLSRAQSDELFAVLERFPYQDWWSPTQSADGSFARDATGSAGDADGMARAHK
jgi:hypothetical protein